MWPAQPAFVNAEKITLWAPDYFLWKKQLANQASQKKQSMTKIRNQV